MQIVKRPVRHSCTFVAVALALLTLNSGAQAADPTKTVAVDCGAGDTIAKALTLGDERKPMLVQISGTCSESVLIERDDVTLAAAFAGATVTGPDPATDVIRIIASRVTIDGLTVTGGRNGITADAAPGARVRNTVVQGTTRNGISYIRGASGVIDGATVTGNPQNGITLDAASATIINSQVTQNGRVGVQVSTNSSARIGLDNANNPAGNTISGNASIGINVGFGSGAMIAMNQITGNGASSAPGNPRFGVAVTSASAQIVGGNTISGNGAQGIFLRSSSLGMGDANFGFTTVNTITSNGGVGSGGGILALLGSSLNIRDAVISNNPGVGMFLTLRSAVQIASSTIQNNNGDGIQLALGSALQATPQNGTVTGNAGFGLNCIDGESSDSGTAFLGVGANGLGGISLGCTGF